MKAESILSLFRTNPNKSYSLEELRRVLKIDKSNHRQFMKLLRNMVRDGALVTNKHKYCPPREADKMEGVVSKHKRGFAFVISEDPEEEDVFLNKGEARPLMDGDRVLVVVRDGWKGKQEGIVLKILERGKNKIVGTLKKIERHYFVIPYGVSELEAPASQMYIAPNNIGGAKEGEVVVADIVKYPDRKLISPNLKLFDMPVQSQMHFQLHPQPHQSLFCQTNLLKLLQCPFELR